HRSSPGPRTDPCCGQIAAAEAVDERACIGPLGEVEGDRIIDDAIKPSRYRGPGRGTEILVEPSPHRRQLAGRRQNDQHAARKMPHPVAYGLVRWSNQGNSS